MMPYELEEIQEKEKVTPQKKIANNFIQNVITSNTESALKIVWYLASIFNKCDLEKDINTFTISEKDMVKATNITSNTIRRNLKSMMKTTITFIDEEQKVDKYRQLIPALDINYDGTIEIDMYTIVAKMIIEVVHNNTTFIDIQQLLKLKNKHSIRLLPLLKTISEFDKNKGIKKQKTEGLKFWNALFGTKYKRLKLIDVEILAKIKEELDNNSTLTFTYKCNKKPVGKGRPGIQDITIIPIQNNNYQTTIFSNFTEQQEQVAPVAADPLTRVQRIQNWEPNLVELELDVEYGIAQQNEQSVKDEFEMYLVEQVEVFKNFCIDNKKDYKNMNTSFKRHITGAYKNNLDFFQN